MYSPYEELEQLADLLPEEGESVVVTRCDGELVCESVRSPARQEVTEDRLLYGRLVHADERLRRLAFRPVSVCSLAGLWGCFALHGAFGTSLPVWLADANLALLLGLGCLHWVRARRERLFSTDLGPMLARQLRQRGVDKYAVIGAARRHKELRTLFGELATWAD